MLKLFKVTKIANGIKKRSSAEDVAAGLFSLGPASLKIGELLALRNDIAGVELMQSLHNLWEKLPVFEPEDQVFKKELGRGIDGLFREFDKNPVARMPFSQVHLAVTYEGDKVAVKVLRPGIEEEFYENGKYFSRIFKLMEKFPGKARRMRMSLMLADALKAADNQMDLCLEAAQYCQAAENFSGDETVCIPKVDWRRTSKSILTVNRVSGVNIKDIQKYDTRGACANMVRLFFNMVFRDGFFCTDWSSDTILMNDDRIILLEFGIMGKIPISKRRYIMENLSLLMDDCGTYQPLHILLLQKSFLEVEKILNILDPEADMWQMLKIMAEEYIEENKGDYKGQVLPLAYMKNGISEIISEEEDRSRSFSRERLLIEPYKESYKPPMMPLQAFLLAVIAVLVFVLLRRSF